MARFKGMEEMERDREKEKKNREKASNVKGGNKKRNKKREIASSNGSSQIFYELNCAGGLCRENRCAKIRRRVAGGSCLLPVRRHRRLSQARLIADYNRRE